jgi:hypothetical protein
LIQGHRRVRIIAVTDFKKVLAAHHYPRQSPGYCVRRDNLSPYMLPENASRRMSQDNVFFGDVDRHRQHYAAFRKKIAAEGWFNKWR